MRPTSFGLDIDVQTLVVRAQRSESVAFPTPTRFRHSFAGTESLSECLLGTYAVKELHGLTRHSRSCRSLADAIGELVCWEGAGRHGREMSHAAFGHTCGDDSASRSGSRNGNVVVLGKWCEVRFQDLYRRACA